MFTLAKSVGVTYMQRINSCAKTSSRRITQLAKDEYRPLKILPVVIVPPLPRCGVMIHRVVALIAGRRYHLPIRTGPPPPLCHKV